MSLLRFVGVCSLSRDVDTEEMDATLVLFSEKWSLPLHAIQQSCVSSFKPAPAHLWFLEVLQLYTGCSLWAFTLWCFHSGIYTWVFAL
jgi:hypothetical protein